MFRPSDCFEPDHSRRKLFLHIGGAEQGEMGSVLESVIEVNPNGIVSISPGVPNPGSTAPPWISTLKAVADL